MKKILLYLCLFLSSFIMLSLDTSFATAINIPGGDEIQDVSLNIGTSGNAIADVSNTGFRILKVIKRILM